MLELCTQHVIRCHDEIIRESGGLPGLRDFGLLESAVMNCYQTFAGVPLYPSVQEKAAHLAFGICKNHPFCDGNKRTAVMSMAALLQLNGFVLRCTTAELVDLALNIATDIYKQADIVRWINEHTSQKKLTQNR